MRKFSIKREKKHLEPIDEQIKRHKDFSRIRHDYELLTKQGKRPIYSDPKLYLLFVIFGLVLLLLFLEK